MVRNTLIAAYILLVLTMAAVARAEVMTLSLPVTGNLSSEFESPYATTCVFQEPHVLLDGTDAPPCVHHEVTSEREAIRRLRESVNGVRLTNSGEARQAIQNQQVVLQGRLTVLNDGRNLLAADNGLVVDVVSEADLSAWKNADVVVQGVLLSMDTPPSSMELFGAPLLRQPSMKGIQALYVLSISEAN